MVIDENGDEKSEIAYDDILDQLIKLYGVETVAEVTGRGRRVVVGVNKRYCLLSH